MAMPAFAPQMSQDHPQAARPAVRYQQAIPAAVDHPFAATATVAAGPLARPGRVVASWMVAVVLVVAGSTAYLSLLVHMAIMGRHAAQLERQLETERRRGEALEVALARETSLAKTEAMARLFLAMEKPKQVRLLVLDRPAGQGLAHAGATDGQGPDTGRAVTSASVARAKGTSTGSVQAGSERHWLARLGAAVAELASKPVALARQLPPWP